MPNNSDILQLWLDTGFISGRTIQYCQQEVNSMPEKGREGGGGLTQQEAEGGRNDDNSKLRLGDERAMTTAGNDDDVSEARNSMTVTISLLSLSRARSLSLPLSYLSSESQISSLPQRPTVLNASPTLPSPE